MELNVFQTAEILHIMREEYKFKKQYFIEHPHEIEGVSTPEDIRKLHNYILEQAQNEGELSFLDPIIIH